MGTEEQHKDQDQKNWLEWLVFSISLLMLVTILGYLVYKTVTYKPADPELFAEAELDPSDVEPNRYKATIYNKGGTTAEAVMVEFILYKNGKELDKTELQLPFLPKESKREGWVNFMEDPAMADSIKAHVVSYKKS